MNPPSHILALIFLLMVSATIGQVLFAQDRDMGVKHTNDIDLMPIDTNALLTIVVEDITLSLSDKHILTSEVNTNGDYYIEYTWRGEVDEIAGAYRIEKNSLLTGRLNHDHTTDFAIRVGWGQMFLWYIYTSADNDWVRVPNDFGSERFRREEETIVSIKNGTLTTKYQVWGEQNDDPQHFTETREYQLMEMELKRID